MNAKERVLAALSHQETDCIPFSLGFGVNAPVRQQLAPLLDLPDEKAVEAYLNSQSDLVWVAPPYIGPPERNRQNEDGSSIDIWGIRRKRVSYGAGYYEEIDRYPLEEAEEAGDLEGYVFPDPDWFDYAALPGIIREAQASRPRAVVLGNANIFEIAWYMRRLDNMMMDLLINPELADALLERVAQFYYVFMQRCLEAADGGIDLIFTADDIGQQQGLLMSLDTWREHIKPHHQRLNRMVHSWNTRVIYHTDGAIMAAVDDLIDMGIDVLEALQFDADGMDPVLLKEKYGDRLCFHGGISVQSTLPFGTPDDVRREVAQRIAVLGAGGGYILAPSHAIQAGTPPENVLAFFQAAGRPLRRSGQDAG